MSNEELLFTLEQIVSNLFFHLGSLLKPLPLGGPELKNIFLILTHPLLKKSILINWFSMRQIWNFAKHENQSFLP